MILSGPEIRALWQVGQIIVEPYDESCLEPNSYGFHLGDTLLVLADEIVDPTIPTTSRKIVIPESGYVLQPDVFYLGHTRERIGGTQVASELYANHSVAAMGMWVQTSAPLGHVGAAIKWTLEICVAAPVRVYPGMRLGKICFWQNLGPIERYKGRYSESTTAVASRIYLDTP